MNLKPIACALTPLALLGLGACATLPADRGRADVNELVAAREARTAAFAEHDDERADALLAERLGRPLSADDAVEIAWLHSPRVRAALAELGLAAADFFDTTRPRNPTLSASRLGGGDKTTLGLSAVISDLLLHPARTRIGRARWRAALADAGAAMIQEAGEVRAAYYRHLGALQVAAMRAAVAEAADTSAELARRFRDAGNISALQLAREQAAATTARTQAAQARAERLATRMALAARLGLAGRTNRWRVPDRLPLPPADDADVDALLALAREQRLDLIAAREELDAGDDGAALARRLRWLGDVELGVEREREDGERQSGPTLALELPLFRQGQAGVARAQAQLELARERSAQIELDIERDVRTGAARLATQREIIDAYRSALLPQREAIVAREQERYNFMLIGAFELIQARQQEYDAYQGYLEAVRDYWLARVELMHAVGGRLPGDDAAAESMPAIDELLAPPARGEQHDPRQHDDPHAGHRQHGDTP